MKYLFILIFLCSLCFGTLETDIGVSNYDNSYIHDYFSFSIVYPSSELYLNLFKSNPIVFYSKRYINDLGHEFPVVSFVCGSYWKGGAWGSRNGFNQYYGNIYYFHTCPINNYYSYSPETVPEPSSLIILSSFLLLSRRKMLKSG